MREQRGYSMKTISIRNVKMELSHVLEQVCSGKISLKEGRAKIGHFLEQLETGHEILITKEGRPIAKIVPIV